MKKIDLLKIITTNATKTVADSITTDFMISGGSLAVGNIASGILNTYSEIKEQAKQAQDALYYFQIKTFLETADLDSDEVNDFLNKNPNNMRLGLEVFKILESTIQEKQAVYIAKAFKLYVKEKINELKLNEYFHLIKQLDSHIIFEIENDLELYKVNQTYGLYGLPTMDSQASIAQFISIGAPKSYIFQKIGFVSTKPKEMVNDYSGSLKPQTIYERTGLYLDFYIDLITSD
ncbi:hypothetical protein [Acinetobacter guillouiae]|uniref:hypothetical protein n=1 Tax=Acinetobacter guillouiae TaxID=106649 RepID=UPI0026E39F37|nr:hypothetical protein [Acinetobacter guillouiae]MDO6644570.1 hypothetical protein [Acinetobacter guillouiae]